MATNWPITPEQLRNALGVDAGDVSESELKEECLDVCERIDLYTGRNVEPTRHEVDGKVPRMFVRGACVTARLWRQQEKNGPRNRPPQGDDNAAPAGIDLPRKVQGWLAPYPPRLFLGSTP